MKRTSFNREAIFEQAIFWTREWAASQGGRRAPAADCLLSSRWQVLKVSMLPCRHIDRDKYIQLKRIANEYHCFTLRSFVHTNSFLVRKLFLSSRYDMFAPDLLGFGHLVSFWVAVFVMEAVLLALVMYGVCTQPRALPLLIERIQRRIFGPLFISTNIQNCESQTSASHLSSSI